MMDDLSRDLNHKATITAEKLNSKERLELLINQVDDETLASLMHNEFQHMIVDQQRLVTMLEQRSELVETENEELKLIINDSQRRYEKAVREMQFFKKKYDRLVESNRSVASDQQHNVQHYLNLTPSSSPQPPPPTSSSTIAPLPVSDAASSIYSYNAPEKLNWPTSPTYSEHVSTRRRNNSNTAASIFSNFSSSTESSTYSHFQHMQQLQQQRYDENGKKPPTAYQFSRNPSMVSSYSTPSTAPSMISSSGASSTITVPMTPVRSTTSVSGYTGNSMIQQRRTDPLSFGGSDALWDTLSKSQGSDITVEKIISNFLRRGGSPNTAKQSPSSHAVKYGYGMIHALIVTKAPGALDLLLQQGANPNVMSISQVDEEKVSPCFLAAQVGWLSGLQKLVQAGGDLISARGGGSRKKTALHVAAEHGHAAIVEYIVNMTQGTLNLEKDILGATALHYACISGHSDLVSFMIKVCLIPTDEQDCKGETALHWATRSGRLEVVTLLIERYGCDVNSYVSKKVSTPYDLAKSAGHKRVAEYLKSSGGITSKKMDKRREEDLTNQVPQHLESALAKNGFFMGGF
ncbi:ankyrin repeat [Mucor ambiguus]|uniref:Ankyrin repeat n=1 Tax=Mucor ambiguus TaxID=91626 RepID=A0A0C9LV30_9FUNG|nr:ankyrin repeat [Mucor ambiguus]